MPIAQFQFSRNLKISRFTIDVLMERLTRLHPPRSRAAEEWERFVRQTFDGLKACDQIHQELGEHFAVAQAPDDAGLPSLSSRFEELHRRIAESIATLNSVEHGTLRTS